jgi:hypothetical protein
MSRKFTVLLVLLAMVALPVSSALAQGDWPVFCGGLSEEDCAIVEQSQIAMAELSAAAFDMSMDFGFTSDDPELDSFQIGLAGTGAFSADPESMAMLQAYEPGNMADMMAEAQTMLTELLQSVSGEAGIVLTLPEGVGAEAGLPDDALTLNVVMVDGVAYLDLASLMPAEAQAESGMPAWMGLDLVGMYEAIFAMAEAEGDLEGLDMDMEEIMNMDSFMALADPMLYENMVTMTRLDDVEVNGQQAAVFQVTFNYADLFTDEAYQAAFEDYMDAVMEMQGVPADEMPDNFMDMMGAVMGGMSMEMTQWIGLDDYYTYHTDMVMSFAMDFEALAEFEPEAADADMPGNLAFDMSMVLDMSSFNEPVEVTAPEGAQVINPMMFMDMPAPASS